LTPSVEIRAGIPNTKSERLKDGRYVYPDTTTDIFKLFRQHGFEVTYDQPRENRAIISLNAAEQWLPVLAFTQSVLANIPANLIAHVIQQYFGLERLSSTELHVKFHVVAPNGAEEDFEAHGSGADVVEAINAFQQRHRG
jgi:hypothetical protein